MSRKVLDACCGPRMTWFDPMDERAVFGDVRQCVLEVTDRSHGNASGKRTIRIEPDVLLDFRSLPFPDESFKVVVFDPPHLVNAGEKSWLAAKYGRLGKDWREDLRLGFSECFRVLVPYGTLVFKWSEIQVKVSEVLSLTPERPLVGNRRVGRDKAHWLVFMKGGGWKPCLIWLWILFIDANDVYLEFYSLARIRYLTAIFAGLISLAIGTCFALSK